MNAVVLLMSVAVRVAPWWFWPPVNLLLTVELKPDKSGEPLVSYVPRAWQPAHLLSYTVLPAACAAVRLGVGVGVEA